MQLNGDLAKVSLNNLLQLVRNGELTGKITLLQGAKTAAIFVEQGNVVHVEADNIKGREALFELFLWVTGSFSFVEGEFGGISRTLNPASPEDGLDRLLREGSNYLEQRKILEQMRISGDTILATTARVQEMITAAAGSPRLASALAMVQPIINGLDGKKPLSEVLADLHYSRRAYVQAMAIVLAEGLAVVVERDIADGSQPVALPNWVQARLQQDNPDLTQAIIDMVIWVDRVKCWMYQADSDFTQILKNLSSSEALADPAVQNMAAPHMVSSGTSVLEEPDNLQQTTSDRNFGSTAGGANESARKIEF